MATPTVLQPNSVVNLGTGAAPLFWLSDAGVLALVNDATPLPVTFGATPVPSTTTQVSAAKTAGQSVTIPAAAKEWTVTVWTGTATINGAAGCPAGFSDGSDKANAASITITFDTPGTGYVRYAT